MKTKITFSRSYKMEEFWTKMKSGIKDSAAFSANKIEEYSKIGKLKIEQFGLKKKVESVQNDLGVRLYDLIKDDKGDTASTDIAILSFVEKIDTYEESIEELAIQIEEIRIIAEEKQKAYDEEKAAETAAEKESKTSEASTVEEDDEEVLGI